MGHYLNPGADKFQMSLDSEIYVDKSELIAKTNRLFRTRQRFICISRPRRFGKTMAAEMLAAYYGVGEDTHALFEPLAIAKDQTYEKHLNQHNVMMINVQVFLSQNESVEDMLGMLQSDLIAELIKVHPDLNYRRNKSLVYVMQDVYQATKRPFVILIDEWDCLFREYKDDLESQKVYLDFLRLWLKDQAYVGLAYMTGILPIKKYGTHSALNMFSEYSMTRPSQFLDYFGFKGSEVEALCRQYKLSFGEVEAWYNGYFVERGTPIYNPTSVTECLVNHEFASYWNNTETYEALRDYIKMDFDDLQGKVTQLLSGVSIPIETRSFANDMTTFNGADDVLTLLVHLGYLTYHFDHHTVRIPNEEIKTEFVTAIKSLRWDHVIDAIRDSHELLQAIWNMEAEVVAEGIRKVHEQQTSILQYHDENSLSCVISLALYGANACYTVIRELPTGKGYADLVYIPKKQFLDKPALVVELKWNKTAQGALSQIKEKSYLSALEAYKRNLLLVGINYEKKTKMYTCMIESLNV